MHCIGCRKQNPNRIRIAILKIHLFIYVSRIYDNNDFEAVIFALI
jgi:hypothetical protein